MLSWRGQGQLYFTVRTSLRNFMVAAAAATGDDDGAADDDGDDDDNPGDGGGGGGDDKFQTAQPVTGQAECNIYHEVIHLP